MVCPSMRDQLRAKLATDEGLRMAFVNQGARHRQVGRRMMAENTARRLPLRHTVRITQAQFPSECAAVEQQLISHKE